MPITTEKKVEKRKTDKRKAQVTVFIIIGLFVLILMSILIYLKTSTIEDILKGEARSTEEFGEDSLRKHVTDCTVFVSTHGLFNLSLHGGYYELPEKTFEEAGYQIPYYYSKGDVLVPTKEVLENQLELYMTDNFLGCVDFEAYTNQGYDIVTDIMTPRVKLMENSVAVDIEYPITATKGNSRIELKYFNAILNVRYKHILETAEEIIESVAERPEYRDLTLILQQDADVSVVPYDPSIDIYIITDLESKRFDGKYITYFFAIER